MTDSTLFDSEDHQNEGGAPETLVVPDLVKDLIGPGKKYADVTKALEALGHSQAHIAKLEEEARKRREEEGDAISREELLKTVQEMLDAERATHGAAPQVDEAVITGLLDRKLTEREQAIVAKANRDTVKKALVEKYGEKAKEHYESRAKELGVGTKFLDDLIAHSPNAAYELLKLEPPKRNAGTATTGSVNSAALQTQVPPSRPAKSVMRGAPMTDVLAEWRRHDPRHKQE